MTPPPKKSIITRTCQSVKQIFILQKRGAPNVSCPHVPLGRIQSRQLALDYCTES